MNVQNLVSRRRTGLLFLAMISLIVLLVPVSASAVAAGQSHEDHEDSGHGARPTVVLVHGDWADGSSWSGVIERLQEKGFTAVAPPNPLRGPGSDSADLRSYLKTIQGPIVLVGHSYGGVVITNAATGNSNVHALVYVDAFIPDEGQTLGVLSADPNSCLDPNTAFSAVPTPTALDLYLRIAANPPYTGFDNCFANGVEPDQAAVLAAVQRPAAFDQLTEPSGPPAWKTIPSWALVGTADHAVTPAQQEAMANHAGAHIATVDAGHLSLITRPDAVTKLILTAAKATS